MCFLIFDLIFAQSYSDFLYAVIKFIRLAIKKYGRRTNGYCFRYGRNRTSVFAQKSTIP